MCRYCVVELGYFPGTSNILTHLKWHHWCANITATRKKRQYCKRNWRLHSSSRSITKHYLGIPATCVSNESVFSTAWVVIITANRYDLSANSVDKLTFLGKNWILRKIAEYWNYQSCPICDNKFCYMFKRNSINLISCMCGKYFY